MVVFDLDGTIALDDHRTHFLRGEVKEWDKYFAACGQDRLNIPVFSAMIAFSNSGKTIGLWTGRSATVQHLTWDWLERHGVSHYIDHHRMRAIGDHTDDTELKRSWLHAQQLTDDPVTLVFEDRQRVVDMWRSEGIVCCQVAPGAF